jgi:hypothetical protein
VVQVTSRLALVLLALASAAGCGRVEKLRLAHANDGTPAEWPPGVVRLETPLLAGETGRPWIGVSVDGSPPVPFLLQTGAGAVAVTGAREPRELPELIGRMAEVGSLLPGVSGGRLVHNRRLGVESLALLDQSVLLVEEADWPHGRPLGGAAGVVGYDLLRRFALEIDRDAGLAWLIRPESVEIPFQQAFMRLAVLERRPYLEAEWVNGDDREWVRLQLELSWPGAVCLDSSAPVGRVVLAGGTAPVPAGPCPVGDIPPDAVAGRDGVLGYGALQGRRLLLDYAGGRAVLTASP